jgi:FixJ family two-component response regulator
MNARANTVAIIDDDYRVLESLVNLLSSFGFKSEPYISAEEFLASGDIVQSCCIITDVEMRRMSGLELLEHLQESNSTIPVIIITGKPSARAEVFYLEKGAAGFFRKPVDSDALLELLSSVCPVED